MALSLTLACGQYDRTIPLQDGSIVPEGINLNFVWVHPTELFKRQARYAEFDVAEFSLSTYTILLNRGDRRFIAIPVFPSRKFRHSEIWVNTNSGIRQPQDLVGKRVGVMEYQQTACVWIRGFLADDYGVRADQVEWYFGGYNQPENYAERIPLGLPPSIRTHTIAPEETLDQLLERGEIDALMGPETPHCFRRGTPHIALLFPNYQEVELEYYRRTRIFPIMHLVVIKREIYERAPWVAASLYKAFIRAQAEGHRRLTYIGALYCSLPWVWQHVQETRELLGGDPFQYGLEQNRHVLEAFIHYNLAHGLIDRPLAVDDLFAVETHEYPDFREL